MEHRCQTNSSVARLEQFEREFAPKLARFKQYESATQQLYIKIKYVIAPISNAGNISLGLVKAQQDAVNKYFNTAPEVSALVGTVNYPFASKMSNPAIKSVPESSSMKEGTHVIRLAKFSAPSKGYFTSVDPLISEFESQGHKMEKGFVYVFITTLYDSSGSVTVGFADDIISNKIALDYRTVGSTGTPGALSNYNHGATLVHELGHAFGLFHPFPSSRHACSDSVVSQFKVDEAPKQILPNYGANIDIDGLTGSNDNVLDNRGRDVLIDAGTTSYLGHSTSISGVSQGSGYSCGSTEYEAYMYVMDYAKDVDIIGFFDSTITTMKAVLLDSDHEDLFGDATDSKYGEYEGSGGFEWYWIVLIVLGAILILFAIYKVLVAQKVIKGVGDQKQSVNYGLANADLWKI